MALVSPNPGELANLAQRSGVIRPVSVTSRRLVRASSTQVVAELVGRYSAGEDTPALGRESGITRPGLRELLRAEGMPMRRQAITSENAEKAVALYEGELTIDEVVKQVGFSYSTVQRLLHQVSA